MRSRELREVGEVISEEDHAHARAASVAAEAAATQTDFWTMQEYLVEHQKALEDADLKRYAVELGQDSDRFAHDRTSGDVENRMDRDLANGERSGVSGTPMFYVNGIRHDGGYVLESPRAAMLAHIDGLAKAN
jgi:protein-disulfide isomerase